MSQRLHVCRICGKKFATPRGLCGHQRIHSGSQRIWGFKESSVCSVSASFMTEIEKHEVIEAAINLVMLSQGVYDFAEFMDLEFTLSSLEKLSTCSDFVAQALASYLRSKLKKKTSRKKPRYKCKICGKSFVCSQVLGGHQTLHRSNKGKLARKMEYIDDDGSLYDSLEAKKIVSEPPSFEVSQEEKMLHCVETKLDFSKLLSHSGIDKSSSWSKTMFSELHSPSEAEKIIPEPSRFEVSEDEKVLHSFEPNLDFTKLLSHSSFDKSSSCSKSKFSKSHSTYRFKICGKSFKCSQASK